MVGFKFYGIFFRVVCLYVFNRNSDRDDFFVFCEFFVDFFIFILLCGDFNVVFDWVLDRRGSNVFDTVRESCVILFAFFDGCCVVDVWRILYFS